MTSVRRCEVEIRRIFVRSGRPNDDRIVGPLEHGGKLGLQVDMDQSTSSRFPTRRGRETASRRPVDRGEGRHSQDVGHGRRGAGRRAGDGSGRAGSRPRSTSGRRGSNQLALPGGLHVGQYLGRAPGTRGHCGLRDVAITGNPGLISVISASRRSDAASERSSRSAIQAMGIAKATALTSI